MVLIEVINNVAFAIEEIIQKILIVGIVKVVLKVKRARMRKVQEKRMCLGIWDSARVQPRKILALTNIYLNVVIKLLVILYVF
jgi:hypothetical protein